MPRKVFYDVPGGDTIAYDEVTEDGTYRMPCFQDSEEAAQANFDSLPNKHCREDDILLNSYPKTGTNWLWEMITMATTKQSDVTGGTKGTGMLEVLPEKVQDALPSPRILNTHVQYKYIPKEAREKKLKCVLLMRNPKDTVVSFFNHTKGLGLYKYEGKFENYLSMFMRGEVDYGSYPDYLLEWQQAIRDNPDWLIHVLYYEDLKEDCFGEMKKLCKYLQLNMDDQLLGKIVDSCEINKMRQGKEQKKTEERKVFEKKMLKNNFSLLRKGQVGGWKDWFTVAQSEMFDKWWNEKTTNLDMFKFRYTL